MSRHGAARPRYIAERGLSIPIDNTSVNPARSFGMAIIAGGEAMSQLWAFFVFPIAGGVLAT